VGISLEILRSDEDLFDVKVGTGNGSFGGVAKLYVDIGGRDKLATIISAFRKDVNDARDPDSTLQHAALGRYGTA